MSRSLIPGLTHLVRRGRPRRTLPYEPVIEALALTELQKLFLRDRWLASVRWFEQAARVNQRLSTLLRLVMVVGGVALPAFIGTLTGDRAGRPLRYLTLTISALVGMSGPLEQLYHAHDRWRLYRFTTELLTSEGWQFFELSGNYRTYASHSEAFPDFASRVEELALRESEFFLEGVMHESRADLTMRTRRAMLGQHDD